MTSSHDLFSNLVTSFFTRHLAAELDASEHTIASYRDAFCLLLQYVVQSTRRPVTALTVDDLDPDRILDFLVYLEQDRNNSATTRNIRLAAIRSFFSYAMTREPSVAALSQKIRAIPFKKTPGRILDYMTEEELAAILDGPDRKLPRGRRDYLLLALLYDIGARVQEILDMRPIDFRLGRAPLALVRGKGRKQRIVPLMPATAKLVQNHLEETTQAPDDDSPLIRNYRGEPMTRSGVTFLISKYCRLAAEQIPALRRKAISPHTFRHTKAMHLLQSGVSPVTIKDILGHVHLKTLEIYVQADLEMKRQALESTPSPVKARPSQRHQPDLLSWLEQL